MKKLTILLAIAFLLTLAVKNVHAQTIPSKPEYIELKGTALFPEGIITLPNNDVLVGGFGDGTIQKIDKNNCRRTQTSAVES